MPATSSSVLYVQHFEKNGRGLFEMACMHDREGIVAKWALAPYRELARQHSEDQEP